MFGRTFEDALQNLDRIFKRIEGAGLLLKPSKCSLFKTSVAFLGHVVSEDGISCDPKKISAVENWAAPSTVKEVQVFVGVASYYRKFILGFATVASPLHALMGNAKFQWSKSARKLLISKKHCFKRPRSWRTRRRDRPSTWTPMPVTLAQEQSSPRCTMGLNIQWRTPAKH